MPKYSSNVSYAKEARNNIQLLVQKYVTFKKKNACMQYMNMHGVCVCVCVCVSETEGERGCHDSSNCYARFTTKTNLIKFIVYVYLVIVYSLNIIILYFPVNKYNVTFLDNQLCLQAYW
jgi:hypothetical protein